MSKQTAVEFLLENMHYSTSTKWQDIIEQAKEMEKEEIRLAYMQGQDAIVKKFNLTINRRINSLQYYNEQFKNK